MAQSDMMFMMMGGVVLIGGILLLKPDILSGLASGTTGTESPEIVEPDPLPTGTDEPVGATTGEDHTDLSNRSIVVDYYAGKVAQSCTKVAERNIYEWREIKNLIIEKYVGAVADIAELNEFQVKVIDENNLGSMRKYATLVLKVCVDMGIRIKGSEKQALEAVAGVKPTVPPAPPAAAPHTKAVVVRVVNTPAPPPQPTVNPKIYYKVKDWDRRKGKWRWVQGIHKSNRAFYFPEEHAMPRVTIV